MIDCLKKKGPFVWTDAAEKAFAFIKKKLTNAPILAFLNFEKVFELECDICGVDIGADSQKKRDLVPFSVKS